VSATHRSSHTVESVCVSTDVKRSENEVTTYRHLAPWLTVRQGLPLPCHTCKETSLIRYRQKYESPLLSLIYLFIYYETEERNL
jgi:hypothetical protein